MGKAKAATAAASARQEVTLALSQPLPTLLRKFQTEPRKVRLQCTALLSTGLSGRKEAQHWPNLAHDHKSHRYQLEHVYVS